jgi:hypothetical protein
VLTATDASGNKATSMKLNLPLRSLGYIIISPEIPMFQAIRVKHGGWRQITPQTLIILRELRCCFNYSGRHSKTIAQWYFSVNWDFLIAYKDKFTFYL